MGNKVSAVHGVKSPDFYTPGNAVNEIWIDKVELASRLPFGDSDLGQAEWPLHDWPKIPWHQFIIPLKQKRNHEALQTGDMNNEILNCDIFGLGGGDPIIWYAGSVAIIEFGLIIFFLFAFWRKLKLPFCLFVVASVLMGLGVLHMAFSTVSCFDSLGVLLPIHVLLLVQAIGTMLFFRLMKRISHPEHIEVGV